MTVKPSKYKYVQKCLDMRGDLMGFMALFTVYNSISGYKGANSKIYPTERAAAIAVDLHLIKHGKNPVNILKKK